MNVRSVDFGWLAYKRGGTGLCCTNLELGRGGMLILVSDLGGREPGGVQYDGLFLRHATFEPFFETDMIRCKYPQLYTNWHWKQSIHSFAGFGIAIANDVSLQSPGSSTLSSFRGMQFVFPLPMLIFLASMLLAVASLGKNMKSSSGFELGYKMKRDETGV